MSVEPTKVKLSVPISVAVDGGGNAAIISEITIGRIKAKHMELIPQAVFDGRTINPAKAFPLLAALTGMSVETLGEMDFVDLTEIMGVAFSQLGEHTASDQTGGG